MTAATANRPSSFEREIAAALERRANRKRFALETFQKQMRRIADDLRTDLTAIHARHGVDLDPDDIPAE